MDTHTWITPPPRTPRVRLSTGLCVGLVALAGAAHFAEPAGAAVPYGPAPASLTWTAPPDWLRDLPRDDRPMRVPRRITEVDVWLVDSDGHATYRLRQRPHLDGWCFTRAHRRRCVAGWDTVNRDLYGWGRRLRAYGWAS